MSVFRTLKATLRSQVGLKVTLFLLGIHMAVVHMAAVVGYISVRNPFQNTPLSPLGHNIPGRQDRRDPESVNSDFNFIPKNQRRINTVVTEYDVVLKQCLEKLVARRASARDPELIDLIRALIDPPSANIVKIRRVKITPQAKAIRRVLKNKKEGFFLECGAFDGEHLSNTVALEQEDGWSGLLIEMDPFFYTQVRGKSRRAYTLNACLGPHDYVSQMPFKQSSLGQGQLVSTDNIVPSNTTDLIQVPCFPLESILLAINRTRIDYFSLDIEGFELPVLRTIPYERIDIAALSVEYVLGKKEKMAYRTFMEEQGYVTYGDIVIHDFETGVFVDDYIFVKKKYISRRSQAQTGKKETAVMNL